jgi:tetratricopeptide (TPR) repeat protein
MDLLKTFEEGNYSEIVKKWREDQNELHSDPEKAYIVAAANFRLGNYEAACELCEGLEGSFSNNVNFLAMYAAILRRLMLVDRAEGVFNKALSIRPDAPDVLNNYSNLLIDQERYEEAERILKELVKKNPNYLDAVGNLERLELLRDDSKKPLQIKNDDEEIFGDPLDEAFEVSEVVKCGSKVGSFTAAVENILPEPKKEDLETADLELLKLAEAQIKTKQYNGALDILSKVRQRKGANNILYKVASDATIGLQHFEKSEILALNAYVNGERSIANFVNLASLSAMRKDQIMARHWLIEAKRIDPKNDMYLQAQELLFPDGKARDVDAPFTK